MREITLTKEEATRWLRRFYRAMREDNALRATIHKGMKYYDFEDFKEYKRNKEFTGLYDPKARDFKIRLNPNKRSAGTMMRTVIHELLHHVEYDKGHSWINPMEKAIYEALTDRQLTNLMKRVFRVGGRNE